MTDTITTTRCAHACACPADAEPGKPDCFGCFTVRGTVRPCPSLLLRIEAALAAREEEAPPNVWLNAGGLATALGLGIRATEDLLYPALDVLVAQGRIIGRSNEAFGVTHYYTARGAMRADAHRQARIALRSRPRTGWEAMRYATGRKEREARETGASFLAAGEVDG